MPFGIMRCDLFLKGLPGAGVRLRMRQGFFICHPEPLHRSIDAACGDPEPGGAFIILGVWMLLNVLGEPFHIYFGCRFVTGRLGLRIIQPANHRGNTNAKTLCRLFNRQPFALSRFKDFLSEFQWICHRQRIIKLFRIGYISVRL